MPIPADNDQNDDEDESEIEKVYGFLAIEDDEEDVICLGDDDDEDLGLTKNYSIEYAKSSRSFCKICKSRINRVIIFRDFGIYQNILIAEYNF